MKLHNHYVEAASVCSKEAYGRCSVLYIMWLSYPTAYTISRSVDRWVNGLEYQSALYFRFRPFLRSCSGSDFLSGIQLP